MRISGRQKVTVSLSTRCLELIDKYAETTGFESRSRVIEETVFAISEFQKYRLLYAQNVQQYIGKTNLSAQENMSMLMAFGDILSKYVGILDRFDRFPSVQQYRIVPPEDRSQNVKPKG